MDDLESLSHTNWECKYHVVFIPKCRRKTLYSERRPHLGGGVSETGTAEGVIPDHAHMLASIPPKMCRVTSDGLHQREKCDPGLWRTEAEFRRSAFLGQRVLRINARSPHTLDPRASWRAWGVHRPMIPIHLRKLSKRCSPKTFAARQTAHRPR